MSYRQSQGGSTAIFVVIAVVLGALALGALYWARNYASGQGQGLFAGVGETTQDTPADDQNQQDQAGDAGQKEQPSDQSQQKSGDERTDQSQQNDDATRPDANTNNGGQTTTPNGANNDATQRGGAGSTEQNQASDDASSRGGASSDTLPQTGPADTLLSVLMLGSLAGVVTAYVRSRQ